MGSNHGRMPCCPKNFAWFAGSDAKVRRIYRAARNGSGVRRRAIGSFVSDVPV